PAVALHQHTLGPLDGFAVLQGLTQVRVLLTQVAQLLELGPGNQNGRAELMGLDRLDQISQHVFLQGAAHQLLVAVGGDVHGRDDALLVNLAQGIQAVEVGEMNVENDQVRLQGQDAANHVRAADSLADDLVAELFLQSLLEKQAYRGIVLDDDDFQSGG